MMINKYNCWEEVKETFGADVVFECEGEMFLLTDVHVFRVVNSGEFVTVDNTRYPNGVIVSIIQNHACSQYTYRKVVFV